MRRWEIIGGLAVLVAVSGCAGGGGGGGGGPPPPPPPFAFAQAGPLYKFFGDAAYTNAASGGASSGAITYSSDAPAVASVDASAGQVTIAGPGIAQITADKAADASHKADQASYTLRVAPRTVDVTAWIGSTDSEVTIAPLPFALDLAHSSDLSCDPMQVLTCLNGAQAQTTSMTMTDITTTQAQPSVYWLKHGPNITSGINLPGQMFVANWVGGTVTFDGRLWTVANSYSGSDEAWSTDDGVNWRLEASNVLGTYLSDFRLVLNNNVFWIITSAQPTNEVWRSGDGKHWTQVTASANFPARQLFSAAAFNGRLWVMGGVDGFNHDLNDVWSSTDGVTWTQNNAAALSAPRHYTGMIEFNGRLWVIGGYGNGAYGNGAYGDVWSSADGTNWTQETAAAAFGGRYDEQLMTDGTRLWLFGGYDYSTLTFHTDVWTSVDGKVWSLVKDSFLYGFNFGAGWWNGKLWVLDLTGSKVWSSPTGLDWTKVTANARLPDYNALTGVGYQGRLWVVGDSLRLWSSADGLSWTQEAAQVPGTIYSPKLLALPDRLILIAGVQYTASNPYREVWQSIDGHAWTKVADDLPMAPEGPFQAVVLNGQLWLFGLNAADKATPEVWSSPDGSNWTLTASNPPYAPRIFLQTMAYGGKLYALAFGNSAYDPIEVWSSTDGVTWTLVSANSALPAGSFAYSLAFNNSMCVYDDVSYAPDGWCSPDGITWTKRTDTAPYGPMFVVDGTGYAVGYTPNVTRADDLVFRSTDGATWRLGYHNTFRFP